MVISENILIGVSSGAAGVLIGAILSSYLDYKFRLSLIKKEFIFKEKAKHYEKILDKINQLYDLHHRALLLGDKEKIPEVIRRFGAMERVMEFFLKLDPPNFNYISREIRNELVEYHEFLKSLKNKKKYSIEELTKFTFQINSFTNKIKKQISKEIKP